ncbi:hypothetical protein GCM10027051_12920 [Niabella terrae]
MTAAENQVTDAPGVNLPPKFPLTADHRTQWIRGLYSLVLYLGLGYMVLRRWDLLLLLSGVLLLHEAGHFLAMKYYRYQDLGILFLPFLGALVRGRKNQISQQQSAVILLAGPLPGLLLGLLLAAISKDQPLYLGQVPLDFVAQLLIWANLLNLLPVYPLDGGQLLNRVYLDEEGRLSTIFMILSAGITGWLAIYTEIYLLFVFPALFIYRLIATRSNQKLEKEMEAAGLPLENSYENLPDADYWQIRSALIQHVPSLQQLDPPPYTYSAREEKIAQMVASVLQRTLLMDIGLFGKLLIGLIWILALFAPWLTETSFSILGYLGR